MTDDVAKCDKCGLEITTGMMRVRAMRALGEVAVGHSTVLAQMIGDYIGHLEGLLDAKTGPSDGGGPRVHAQGGYLVLTVPGVGQAIYTPVGEEIGRALMGHLPQGPQPLLARGPESSPAYECSKTCTDTECTVYAACKRHGGSTLRPSQPGCGGKERNGE